MNSRLLYGKTQLVGFARIKQKSNCKIADGYLRCLPAIDGGHVLVFPLLQDPSGDGSETSAEHLRRH